MAEIRIWRSLLFIPANNWKMLNKAATEMEDAVLIDLEDACPVAERETGRIFARDIAPALKSKGIDVLARINSLSSGVTAEDLKIIVTKNLDGIMLPKAETREDIRRVSILLSREEKKKKLKRKIAILPLLESPRGILNAREIATASRRVAGLGFGAGDYMRELGEGFTIAKLTPDEYFPILLYPRTVIANTALAFHLLAIDTPFFGLLIDTAALERETANVKLLGFKGKMLTHPRHIETVNRIFSPSEEEVSLSRRMVAGYREAAAQGKGSAVLDGRMIDYAMYQMGLEMLARADGIAQKAKLRAGMV